MNRYYIEIEEEKIDDIESMLLCFSDGYESIRIFGEEIIDMKLEFEEEMVFNNIGFNRVLKDGFLKIRFSKSLNSNKRCACFNFSKNDKIKKKQIEKRLCDLCDIQAIEVHKKSNNCEEEFDVPCKIKIKHGKIKAKISSSCQIDKDGDLLIQMGESSGFVKTK
ncbi:MAG: hypothetical protein R3Y32_06925 [Bacillota bacterium]